MNGATSTSTAALERKDRNYPVHSWWVGATSAEIGGSLLSRWLLDRRVVLFRKRNGEIAALEDRCPHRAAPLSKGTIVDDDVICPYHGFRYDAAGRCVKVPSQTSVPNAIRVRAFPARERAGFVWLWMGDQAAADDALLPDAPWTTDRDFLQIDGHTSVAANYMLIQENILDLTHFSHLHANSLQQQGWDKGPDEVEITDRTVLIRKITKGLALAPFMAMPMGLEPDAIVDRDDWGLFHSPGCHYGGSDVSWPDAKSNERNAWHWRIMHCTTPASATETHYWWRVSQDFAQDQPDTTEIVVKVTNAAFDEDKDIIEEIQRTYNGDYRGAEGPEYSVGADRAAIAARRIVARMLEAESSPAVYPNRAE